MFERELRRVSALFRKVSELAVLSLLAPISSSR
jgi:hypothetical protein